MANPFSSLLGAAITGTQTGVSTSKQPTSVTTTNVRNKVATNQDKLQQLNSSLIQAGQAGSNAGFQGSNPNYAIQGGGGGGGSWDNNPSGAIISAGQQGMSAGAQNYNQNSIPQNNNIGVGNGNTTNLNDSGQGNKINQNDQTPPPSDTTPPSDQGNGQNTNTNFDSSNLFEQQQNTPTTQPQTSNLPPLPQAPDIDARMKEMDSQLAEYNKLLDAQKASMDDVTKSMVSSIQESYNRRRAQMEDVNKRYLAGLTTANMAAGLSRYAPQISDQILSTEERAGIQKLADLDSDEKREILQANIANQEKNFQLLDMRLSKIDAIRKEKSQLVQQQFENTMATEKANRERIREEQDMKFKTDQMNMEAKRFAMEQDKYNFDRQERVLKRQTDLAGTISAQLVDLDDNMNVQVADWNTIRQVAQDAGVDPNVLAGEMNKRASELRKTSLDERKFKFDQFKYGSDQALDQEKLNLEKAKFSLDKYNTQFNQQMKLEEMSGKASSLGLSPSQINDAVSKGYKTEAELALYRQQVAGGVAPAPLKEKSAEQKKLDGNILSGLSSLSIIRDAMKNSVGRGKFMNGEYKVAESNLVDVIGRLRSGGAISEDEAKTFKSLLPSMFRGDQTNLSTLQELENTLINIMGRDSYKEEKSKIFADVNTFQQFGTKEEKKDFDSFMKSMNPKPGDDINDYFEVFRQQKGFNQPLSMGVNGSLQSTFIQKYPEGTTGGQCGDFAHKLVQFPSVGNSLSQKRATVDKIGIPANTWRSNAKVGDVVITNENPTYGHVAVVTAILPNGFRVSESNFKQSNKISHDRVIPFNSSKIYGAIRGSIKV